MHTRAESFGTSSAAREKTATIGLSCISNRVGYRPTRASVHEYVGRAYVCVYREGERLILRRFRERGNLLVSSVLRAKASSGNVFTEANRESLIRRLANPRA